MLDFSVVSPASITNHAYRGRLAPSPTGFLHLGHARTFWIAQQRARANQGVLVLRNEDLDPLRSKPEFTSAMLEDLRWLGLEWQEGPDCGGTFGPYSQSDRGALYHSAWEKLSELDAIYPCRCSRGDVQRALQAPHPGEEEPIYPGTCRPIPGSNPKLQNSTQTAGTAHSSLPPSLRYGATGRAPAFAEKLRRGNSHSGLNWRFRVPDGEAITFVDGQFGPQQFVAGKDFGDFIVWRHEGAPSYELAVVVDDAAMRITEVVRGADLLLSTARQILLYRALGLVPPDFHHCPLMTDEKRRRLAKRHDALSLRALRARGITPGSLHAEFASLIAKSG